MPRRSPSEGERALQQAVQTAFEQQLQEALHLQEQRSAAALREAVGELERKLQEKDVAYRALEQRVAVLEGRAGGSEGPSEEGVMRSLEGRMRQVETSLERAVQTFFPRVDGLLRQLEQHPRAEPASCVPSLSSPTDGNNCAVTSTEGPAASGRRETPSPTAPRPSNSTSVCCCSPFAAVASSRIATVTREREVASPEEDDEHHQRELVERRIQEAKEKMNAARTTPCPLEEELDKAIAEDGLREVRRLLDLGANVNYVNKYGCTPLIRAIVYDSCDDVVALLLERGADPNAVNSKGTTAMHLATEYDNSAPLVNMLIDAGGDVNARRKNGVTPLHNAVGLNNEDAVRALLSAGARRDLKPWDGPWKNKTPYDLAKTSQMRDHLRS